MLPMTIAFRTADSLAAHAVCAAAGVRDGLRAAQFYARDLSLAGRPEPRNAPFLTALVARLARLTDCAMTLGANLSIRVFLPGWRKLPSPFAPGILDGVAEAIRKNSLVQNPLFNAYFFRAAIQIIKFYSEPPWLVLEHRIDAARRQLAQGVQPETETAFLARALFALVDAAPIAKIGRTRESHRLFDSVEPNIAVCAIACVSLLFASQGKPMENLGDSEFLAITGALVLPRLKAVSALIAARDEAGLTLELGDLKSMY